MKWASRFRLVLMAYLQFMQQLADAFAQCR
jgi:hypothetical protein